MDGSASLATTRRGLLATFAAGAAAGTLNASARRRSSLEAIAFDAFVLFDPRRVVETASKVLGRDAKEFVAAASARIFAYTWYYTSAQQYEPFPFLAAASLRAVADAQQLTLDQGSIDAIVQSYSSLDLWPDVVPILEILHEEQLHLIVLSNLPEDMLVKNLCDNRIGGFFEDIISTDRVRRFKPAPEAYALGPRALKLDRSRIGFAASASWDASGARWFGFPTVWVNRTHAPIELAHKQAEVVSTDIEGVLRLAAPHRRS